MRVAGDRVRLLLVIVAVLAACKVAPRHTELVDDLDQIEAELRRSDARLSDAGIVVAYREAAPPPAAGAPPETPPPAEEPPTPEDDMAKTEPEPGTEPPAPTSTAPPVVEPSPADEEADAPALSGRTSERGVERERDSKRRRVEHKRVSKASRTRCERVCELSTSTCELTERVCGLAGRHPDDVRYEDACRRAEDQCEAATRSCESCAV